MNIVFIIDASLSVLYNFKAYMSIVNGILGCMGPNDTVSCVTFNEKATYFSVNNLGKRELTESDISPSGGTALYDQVCNILRKLGKFQENNLIWGSTLTPTLAIILTDGEDTCSKLLSAKHLALQIATNRRVGWKFVFLGLTQNSARLGREVGCDTCIFYDMTEASQKAIISFIRESLDRKAIPVADLDLRALEEGMAEMKLV